ncbi:MAG TPA: peroxide stress protein YaaA [Chitinophagaceae bacterium]|nr:peroxide stress protein YaaA [Chitinophagaceae bacterium]
MKIIISPAKSLDYKSELPTKKATKPQYLKDAKKLNNCLRQKSREELSKLMKISAKLADLNYERYQDFHLPFTTDNARPAVFAYAGDVYTGLNAYHLSTEKLDLLQDKLRILSGMYGLLRPLDLIQPYRLEMGIKLAVDDKKDLYDYWKERLTKGLNDELEENELFLNLASNEYAKAIDQKKLKVPIISPIFKDFKNGKLKIISFYAKKARGSMVRYIIDKGVKELDGVKGFNYGGYSFSEKYTEKQSSPVFVR